MKQTSIAQWCSPSKKKKSRKRSRASPTSRARDPETIGGDAKRPRAKRPAVRSPASSSRLPRSASPKATPPAAMPPRVRFRETSVDGIRERVNQFRKQASLASAAPQPPSSAQRHGPPPIMMMVLDWWFESRDKLRPVRLLGTTHAGEPIEVAVENFHPYFHVRIAPDADLTALETEIQTLIHASKGSVRACKAPKGYRPLLYYRGDESFEFARVSVSDAKLLRPAARAVEKWLQGHSSHLLPDHWHPNPTVPCDPRWCVCGGRPSGDNVTPVYALYESQVSPIQQFVTDVEIEGGGRGLSGGAWICVWGIESAQASAAQTSAALAPGRVRTIRVDWGGPDRKGPAPIKAQCDRFLSFAPLRMLAIRVSCAAGGPNNASVATSSATVMTTSAFKTPPRKRKEPKSHTSPRSGAGVESNDCEQDNRILSHIAMTMGDGRTSPNATFIVSTESVPRVKYQPGPVSTDTDSNAAPEAWWAHVGSEKALIESVVQVFHSVDPDILAGYRVASDDMKVLFNRGEALGVVGVRQLARVGQGTPSSRVNACRVKAFQTYGGRWVKQGRRMSHISNEESAYLSSFSGRMLLDAQKVVQGSRKLDIYTLRTATREVLGATVADTLLPPDTSASTSAKPQATATTGASWWSAYGGSLAAYKILQHLATVTETVELARATGLTLEEVWTRGQMARVWNLLLRACRGARFLVGDTASGRAATAGAQLQVGPLVLDCVNDLRTTGLHQDPVVVLDFASMYPSIMIAHNLCYSTLVPKAARLPKEKVFTAPADYLNELGLFKTVSTSRAGEKRYRFASEVKGVLPGILSSLLKKRAFYKKSMREATDAGTRAIFNARQKALKVCANAVYGFTGTNASRVYLPALAETVLITGVSQLVAAARFVNGADPASRGLAADSTACPVPGAKVPHVKVIYGDTDSLMVRCFGQTVEQARRTGAKLGRLLSDLFPDPCAMKLEVVYSQFLLQHNKHYAGVVAGENHEGSGSADGSADGGQLVIKGMEAVSRRALPILRKLYRDILEIVLLAPRGGNRRAVKRSVQRVIETGTRVLRGQCEQKELVLSRALWMDDTRYDKTGSPDKGQYSVSQPHVSVARKLRDRGHRVRRGERIAYVLVHPRSGATKKQFEMAEDPEYARDNELPLNLRHYVDHLIVAPLLRLFELKGILGSRSAAVKAFAPLKSIGVKQKISTKHGIGKFFAQSPVKKK